MAEKTRRRYIAWELCGDWWWVGTYYARILGGKTLWQDATATRNQRVKLRGSVGLKCFNRYVWPGTRMVLVPIASEREE